MTDTLLIVAAAVVVLVAIVTLAYGVWELSHTWWTPEDSGVADPVRPRDDRRARR